MIIIAIYTRGQAARGKEQGGRGKEWGGKGDKGERGKGRGWGRGTEVRGESQKKFNPLPPSVSIMKHNTVKNRPSVRVILFKTGKGLYLSLKIFSD